MDFQLKASWLQFQTLPKRGFRREVGYNSVADAVCQWAGAVALLRVAEEVGAWQPKESVLNELPGTPRWVKTGDPLFSEN